MGRWILGEFSIQISLDFLHPFSSFAHLRSPPPCALRVLAILGRLSQRKMKSLWAQTNLISSGINSSLAGIKLNIQQTR